MVVSETNEKFAHNSFFVRHTLPPIYRVVVYDERENCYFLAAIVPHWHKESGTFGEEKYRFKVVKVPLLRGRSAASRQPKFPFEVVEVPLRGSRSSPSTLPKCRFGSENEACSLVMRRIQTLHIVHDHHLAFFASFSAFCAAFCAFTAALSAASFSLGSPGTLAAFSAAF